PVSASTFAWTSDRANLPSFPTRRSSDLGSSSALNTSLVTSHAVALAGLNGSTLYHYRVRSRDAAGNPATSADFSFTTSDTTAPTSAEHTSELHSPCNIIFRLLLTESDNV